MRRSDTVLAGGAAALAFAATLLLVVSGPDDVVDLPAKEVGTAGVAVVTNPNVVSRVGPTVHLTVRRTAPADTDLVLALGHTEDVRSYLGQAPHEVVVQVLPEVGAVRTRAVTGDAELPAAPTGQDFWVLERTGPGTVTARWRTTDGVWSWAVLNADGSPGLQAEVTLGVEVPGLFAGALAVLVLDLLAAAAVTVGLRRRRAGLPVLPDALRRRPGTGRAAPPAAPAAVPVPAPPDVPGAVPPGSADLAVPVPPAVPSPAPAADPPAGGPSPVLAGRADAGGRRTGRRTGRRA